MIDGNCVIFHHEKNTLFKANNQTKAFIWSLNHYKRKVWCMD